MAVITLYGTQYDVPALGSRVAGDLNSAPDPSFMGKR